ncbi:helix-turn-helix domain-containing protein [Variovorax terrae]|uniref:Helix-turn-helix domain-containing protein n=1 Tax=Variovorax terrae TaxID=2923278 RepID=A0A9X1VXT6_9BURK|nr:helix-turn-helix domain-containing protein [Variovorax terrae]MCJ0764159.1 helix-turn-helix domain-containing protein [Variovorax terrae]
MTNQVLEPANEAEAEMAAVATACLVKALDHSKAKTIRMTMLFDDGQGDCPELLLPPRALRFFADVLRQMARREPMLLMPQHTELTTQEAAAMLNVSRPFVIKEIDAGRIKCRMVNRHRRILFVDLVQYQAQQKKDSAAALKELSQVNREIGQEL